MSSLKTFHVCPRDIADIVSRHAYVWHWATLPDGNVLLSTEFSSDYEQEVFETHATVEPLPHILDASPLEPKHVNRFSFLGIKQGDNMKTLRKLAKQNLHRLL